MEKYLKNKEVVITTFIAIETIHYLFRRLEKTVAKEKALVFIQGDFKIIDVKTKLLEKLVEKLYQTKHFGLGGRDASILIAMEEENIDKILTHDQAFKKIPSLTVIDPIS